MEITTKLNLTTLEQYKVLEYLKASLDIDSFALELVDRYSIKVTDCDHKSAIFKYNELTKKIGVQYL